MKTQALPDSLAALNKIMYVVGSVLMAIVFGAFVANLFGWIRDPFALLLELPLFVLMPCSIVVSGVSAEIVVLIIRALPSLGVNWSERTYVRLLAVLWILFAASQIIFLVRFHPH